MAQGDLAQGDLAEGGGENARASDARLTELLRTSAATAYPALRELRLRHHARVLDYARLCTASESSARQLAAQTLTTAARETARGVEPRVPLRHQLLLLTARSAAAWAADERAAGRDPGLLLVLNTSGAPGTPGGPTPPLLPAFRSLPSRTQGLIWYGVVEREPAERTATFLGLTREDVTYGIPQALQAMAQACLRSRLAASDDPRCGDFRRLIEESVRPGTPRHSPDLHAHMGHCPHCTAAYEDLTALRDDPRRALAEGLLPWSGAAYVRDEAALAAPESPVAHRSWPPSRRLLLASAALGAALAPVLVFLLTRAGSPDPGPAAAAVLPTSPPVTVTTTATVSSSPSTESSSPSPSPTRTSHPPLTSAPPKPKPSPTPSPPGAAYAQVVNVATGRCLDVRDGDFEKGTDVITAPCSASPTQRWRVDTDRGVLQSGADPDFCLDSRGSADRGVGIWECASVDGRNGLNLRFTVDSDGVIRPAIAVGTAVTADGSGGGGDGVVLAPLDGGSGQRWRAGAA